MTKEPCDLWIGLGRVVSAHGIKGALSVKLDNPHSKTLRPGVKIKIITKNKSEKEEVVEAFQAGRILYLEGLHDRNAAELFHQAQIFVQRSNFPALKDDEIYLNDMLGFEVVDEHGSEIGVVKGFSDNTTQVLLEVRSHAGASGLIPFVAPLIKRVDQKEKQIIVDLPEGLFETEGAND